ncbi:MAG: DUF2207 domain-containing protein, partial [Longimicrobiales bacterium]
MGDRRTGLTITALGRVAWPPLRPFLCGVVLAVLLSLAGSNASAQKRSMVVERFDATIQVEENGWIDVREEIQVRFTGSWNGIFRNIPVEYRTPQGFSYKLWLDDVSVTGMDAEPLEYWNKRERHYRQLKIRVTGANDALRTVVIRYRVPNGLKYWEEYEELYWNVTGDEWDVPIQAATATILLPEGLDGLRTASWTGGYGSTENGAQVSEIEGGFYFESSQSLNFREGMTVAIAWNPGVLSRPTAFRLVGAFLRANWLLFLPFLSLGWMWRVWYTRGRDPRRRPIPPQYSPPDDLTPAQAGTLIDNRPDMRDITASLVDLAVRGYLRIEEVENSGLKKWFKSTDYRIVSLRDMKARSGLHGHEQELLRGVFAGGGESVLLSSLEAEFYTHLPSIKSALFEELMERAYYNKRPDKVFEGYLALGAVVLVVGIAGGIPLAGFLQMSVLSAIVGAVGSALPIMIFGFWMPARTGKGARAFEHVLGFEEFLDRVESGRYERIEKTPEMFERYLPYAMAFGVEKHWAKAFEGMFTEPPDWYHGRWDSGFRSMYLTDSLRSMSSAAGTAMA